MSSSDDHIHKPTPRRNFILGDSFDDPTPESDLLGIPNENYPNPSGTTTPGGRLDMSRRSQSIRNLTTSALFGIFQAAYDSVPSTPGLTRDQSYAHIGEIANGSNDTPISSPATYGSKQLPLPRRRIKSPQSTSMLLLRAVLLFLSGASYGFVIHSLNHRGRIAQVNVDMDRYSPVYLTIWGLAGVAMGSLLPWIDAKYEDYVYTAIEEEVSRQNINGRNRAMNGRRTNVEEEMSVFGGVDAGPSWSPVMRSVGTFVGIAYAIRKLPWESKSQASATLAFVNPALWYLVDRSVTGFCLSAVVSIIGTLALLGIDPDFIPQAVTVPLRVKDGVMMGAGSGIISKEVIGATTWIASVLFCSAVCFGNIGRRLAGSYREEPERKRY